MMTSDSRMGEELRGSTRAPLAAPVTLQLDAFSEPRPGYAANVSAGGMFVNVDPQPRVGTIVRFEVDIGEAEPSIRGVAEVVWIRARPRGSEWPAGMGLQFRFPEGDRHGRVRMVVQKIIDTEGEPNVPPAPRKSAPAPGRVEHSRTVPGSSRPAPLLNTSEKPANGTRKDPLGLSPKRAKILAASALFALLLLLLQRTFG